MANYSVEDVVVIWNDGTGERIEVGPDREVIGLCEIRQYTDDSKKTESLICSKEQALLIAEAIQKLWGKK